MNALRGVVLKEGWRYIGAATAAALLFLLFDFELLSLLAIGVTAWLLWNFHNPSRQCASYDPQSVVAPCDGVVRAIENSESGSGFVVEIETGCLNASVLCAPMDGKIERITLRYGAQLGRRSSLFEPLNETALLRFVNERKDVLTLRHRLLPGFAPLSLEREEGEYMVRGLRYGVMLRGITRLCFPEKSRLAVNIGERVYAGETLLGYLA